jgi:hypothetical protein
MTHHLETSITINANLETVWNTFTDFDSYPEWNSFIKSVKGEIKVGERIEAEITGMKFTPKIEVFDYQKELTWLGNASIPYIFDGRHSFIFTENSNGTTHVIHKEYFRGILVPFMKKKLRTEIKDGFKHWNEILKTRAER